MSNIKLHISSIFDCVLLLDKKIYLKADYTTVEIEAQQNDSFFVYPTQKGISYAVCIENGKVLKKDCIEVVEVLENQFILKLKPYQLFLPPQKIECKTFSKFDMALVLSKPLLLKVEKNKKQYFYKLDDEFNYYEFLSFQDIPCALFKNDNLEVLICFNNDKFECFKGQIKIGKNQIEVISPLMDISHRAKLYKLKVQQSQLKIESEELIYLDNMPIFPKNEALIPFAFFQAVKCGDINYAKKLVDEENLQITNQILKDYFGEFDEILHYNYNKQKGHFIALVKNGKSVVYKISLNNGKIFDIDKISK